MVKVRLKLDTLIDNKGVTQMQMAEAIEVRQATISRYRKGFIDNVNLEILAKMMDYFELNSFDDIFELIDEDGSNED